MAVGPKDDKRVEKKVSSDPAMFRDGNKDATKDATKNVANPQIASVTIEADVTLKADTESNSIIDIVNSPADGTDEIDYLHPDGKPAVGTAERKTDAAAKAGPDLSTQKSIDEADGHHMCSDKCREKHRV